MWALQSHSSSKNLKDYLGKVHAGNGGMYPVFRVLWIKPLLPEQSIIFAWFSVVPQVLITRPHTQQEFSKYLLHNTSEIILLYF